MIEKVSVPAFTGVMVAKVESELYAIVSILE